MPQKLDDCVAKVQAQGKTKSEAFAICNDSLKESRKYEVEDKGDRLYIKSFLLDSSVNLNEWGVDEATLDQNINTYIGKPIVVQEDFDHPQSGDPNYDHHLNYQDRFRIGTIIDITQKDGIYSSIAEITDPDAREAIRQGNLPSYVSPQLFHDGVGKEPDDKAKTWRGTHLAIVKDPAYGVKKARITGQCNGEAGVCLAQLKKASCKFCIKKTIEQYKQAKVSNNQTKVSSLQTENLNNKSKLSTETKSYSEEEYQKIQNQLKEANEKVKSLESISTEKDTVISQLKQANDDVTSRVAQIEKENRTKDIANVLSAVKFNTDEERTQRIDVLVNSNLPVDEIKKTYEPLVSVKQASIETRLPLKSASEENKESSYISLVKNGGFA